MGNERHDVTSDICDRGLALAPRLPVLRRRLSMWARRAGLPADEVADLALACHEALANVIDHAYGGEAGEVTVSATTKDARLIVTVTDYGRWQGQSALPGRGRGLQLITSLTPVLDILRTANGTTIRMCWPLPAGI